MRAPRWILVVATFAGCVIQTNRTQGLGDGEIHGTAVRKDKKPAAGAVVSLAGSNRVTRAGADGSFVFTGLVPGNWLVHIIEDDEGDGVAERAAYVATHIKFVPVPKNATDGCTGTAPTAVTSQLLGDIALDATLHVTGHVAVDAALVGSDAVRVVVWRDLAGHQAPIEASGGVKLDGSYDVAGVAPGHVHVAAFAFNSVDSLVIPLFYGSADGDAGSTVNITVDQKARTDADPNKLRTTPVQIEAQWNSPKTRAVSVDLVTFLAPDDDDGQPLPSAPSEGQFALDDATNAFIVDGPIGVVDIAVQTSTDGASGNTLRGAVVIPGVSVLGPLELPVFADPCVDANNHRDCDHDGSLGLPTPGSADVDAKYHACAASCADQLGVSGAGASCSVDQSDCDDDGDGQPDVTEPAHCIGPGKGTDVDGDGLCEPNEDPFPLCAANTALDCPAAFTPPAAQY